MRKWGVVIYWTVAAAVVAGAVLWACGQARGECSHVAWHRTQCGPYGCQVPRTRPSVWLTPRVQQPTGYQVATVRITNQIGRQRSIGSGVLVRHDGYCAVLTCAHLFSEGTGRIWVAYTGGKQTEARLCGKDRLWDMAVLSVSPPQGATLAELAEELPKKGDALESCGYGSQGQFAVNRGKFVAFRMPGRGETPDWIELSGRARSGDSGGPVFNARGRVAGILFGTDNRVVNGVSVGRLRVFLERWTGKGTTEDTEGTEKIVRKGLFSRNRERPLLPIPNPRPPTANPQSPIPNPSAAAGCLLPRRQPTPAPVVPTITVGAEVRQSLENLEAMAVQRNDQLQRIVQNTTPPEEEEGQPPGGLGVVLAVAAALVVGVVLFYSTQSHTPL